MKRPARMAGRFGEIVNFSRGNERPESSRSVCNSQPLSNASQRQLVESASFELGLIPLLREKGIGHG